jgi:hypothetical protein
MSWLRMSGTVHLLPMYAFVTWTGTASPFYLLRVYKIMIQYTNLIEYDAV